MREKGEWRKRTRIELADPFVSKRPTGFEDRSVGSANRSRTGSQLSLALIQAVPPTSKEGVIGADPTARPRAEIASEVLGTLREFAGRWLALKTAELRDASSPTQHWRDYIEPFFGDQPIGAIRRCHIRVWLTAWLPRRTSRRTGRPLSGRTRRHIFYTLHGLFRVAMQEDVIESSPCEGLEDLLPPNADADPMFTDFAVYPREDAAMLVWSPLIHPRVRMAARLGLFAAIRRGELAAFRWGWWVRNEKPLSALLVHESYRSQTGKITPPKNGRPRPVPAHPTLAGWMAEWRLSGWAEIYGRPPTDDDLVIPWLEANGSLTYYSTGRQCAELRVACAELGIRYRAIHPFKATFISLAQEDGGAPDILERVTHASPTSAAGPVFAKYGRFSWVSRCREVAKLQIPEPMAAVSGGP